MTPTEKRIKEAINELRKAHHKVLSKDIKVKPITVDNLTQSAHLMAWANGVEWTLDNIEAYIKNGRML